MDHSNPKMHHNVFKAVCVSLTKYVHLYLKQWELADVKWAQKTGSLHDAAAFSSSSVATMWLRMTPIYPIVQESSGF